jgi:transcriptional regulator with XRE-family HTH domain
MSTSGPEAEAEQLDREIGARLKMARKARGLSQTELGQAVGVTFQQVQKYERGANRVSSSALILIARHLDVPVTELLGVDRPPSSRIDWGLFDTSGAQELLDSYRRIPSPKLRRLLLDLAREIAGTESSAG